MLRRRPLLERGGAAGALGAVGGVRLGLLAAAQRPLARGPGGGGLAARGAGLGQPLPVQLSAARLAAVLQAVALGLAGMEQRVRLHLHNMHAAVTTT